MSHSDRMTRNGPVPLDEFPHVRARRRGLWLLLVPVVLYCAAPLVANSVEPRILGVPFLLSYFIAVTVVSPLVIWGIARRDPAYRVDAVEPIPADDETDATAGGAR
jgi:hypothetical protein